MLDLIRNLGRLKAAPEFRDGTFGVLARDSHGVWNGEMAYRSYHVSIHVAGDQFEPSKLKLIRARILLDGMEGRVNSALDFAAKCDPKLWRGKLSFSALDLSANTVGDRYALRFVAVGERSGGCWRVSFENGKPVKLDCV